MATDKVSLKFIRVPNTDTNRLICNQRKYKLVYTSKKDGKKSWVCCVTNCNFMVYTKNGLFQGFGPGKNPKHDWKRKHSIWTSVDQEKNDSLVSMTDDITVNDEPPHQAYTLHCVNNPESAKAIANYDKVRKTLYKARSRTGAIPLPEDGKHANQLLTQSRFGRNHYGQQLRKTTITDEELDKYNDIEDINNRISAIQMHKKQLNDELNKCEQIKRLKFDDYKSKDSLLFLGGSNDGMYQVFAERESAIILTKCDGVFFDGSWGSTPLLSTKCKRRNHYRMSWDVNACFRNVNDEQAPLIVKCAVILFAVDKPSKSLYEEALRLLVKRCKEEFDVELFVDAGVELLVMADFERPMRAAIRAVIPFAIMSGCWFHFCKCLVGKMADLGLMKLYKNKYDHTFYEFMRGFLMLALLPRDLIPLAFELLIDLGKLNVPRGYKKKFNAFIKYMKRTWMNGLYDINEWCVYGSWVRTNNLTESMNFATSQLFGKHPLYTDWIKALALQFASHIVKYNQYKIWRQTKRRQPREIEKNTLLHNEWRRIAKDISPKSIVLFLRRCSKAMKVSAATLIIMNESYSVHA